MLPMFFLFISRAYALDIGVKIPGTDGTVNGYCGYIKALSQYSIAIGLILSLMMIAYAGIRYVTSQGNQTALNDAKEILYGVAIGFILLFLMNFVLKFLVGSDACTVGNSTENTATTPTPGTNNNTEDTTQTKPTPEDSSGNGSSGGHGSTTGGGW